MTGRQVLLIVIATFITAIIWVVVDILHSRSQVQIPAQTQQLIEPIDPNFDQEVLNGL